MKKFKIFLVVIILIGIAVGAYLVFFPYSVGDRAGTVIKLSKKGWIFKTYEGQLNTGMAIGDFAAANNLQMWDFSVRSSNEDVIKTLNDAMLSGRRVKLHYNERYFRFFWAGDTKYFIDEVEMLK